MAFETIGSPLTWAAFVALVIVLLALDLGVFHRKTHAVGLKEAGVASVAWIALAAAFGLFVHARFGRERALEFAAGYLIEKALAADNLFVFVLVFSAFAIPARQQHRVLFWGVLGALVMRAAFIVVGGAVLARFHFAVYVFGGILAVTGVKLLLQRDTPMRLEESRVVRLFQRFVPVTHEPAGDRFTVVRDGRRYATPLLLALVAIEVGDVVFAVESIPAIFAVTSDPFIVFTSNVFAILGLRSLYFLLAGVIQRFVHLKVGLAVVLVFVGAKMLLGDVYVLPVAASLGVIVAILGASVVASLWAPAGRAAPARPAAAAEERSG